MPEIPAHRSDYLPTTLPAIRQQSKVWIFVSDSHRSHADDHKRHRQHRQSSWPHLSTGDAEGLAQELSWMAWIPLADMIRGTWFYFLSAVNHQLQRKCNHPCDPVGASSTVWDCLCHPPAVPR